MGLSQKSDEEISVRLESDFLALGSQLLVPIGPVPGTGFFLAGGGRKNSTSAPRFKRALGEEQPGYLVHPSSEEISRLGFESESKNGERI